MRSLTGVVQKPLDIVIVHRSPLFCLGLRSVLERYGMQVIGQTVELSQGVVLATLCPDVLLFDASLAAYDERLVVQLRQAGARSIFVFAESSSEEYLFRFLMAGASAYERGGLTEDDLVEKVRRVAAGECLISGEILQPRVKPAWQVVPKKRVTTEPRLVAVPSRQQSQEHLGITDREIEVLQCVMHGLTNKEVARMLRITHDTVKNHLTNVLRKFQALDRTSAVVCVLRYGLITVDDPLPGQQKVILQVESHEISREEAIAV